MRSSWDSFPSRRCVPRRRGGNAVCMGSPLGELGNLADTIVIKDGNVFLVTLRDGRLPADVEHPLGLWFRDCRFLCVHELRICGAAAAPAHGHRRRRHAGRPRAHESRPRAPRTAGEVPGESLRLRVERTVEAEGALRQRIAVRSYHRQPIQLPLELRLGADFLPMLELRGVVPKHERPPPDAGPDGFSLVGRDGVRRDHRDPRDARAALPRGRLARVRPRPRAARRDRPGGGLRGLREQRRRGLRAAPRASAHEDGTTVTSDDQLFNRILARSLDDLELLRSELDGHSYYAAGVPWFATLFGRDSLITSFQTLSFVRGIAGGDAAAAGRPARAGVQRRARRGARQGPPRAARGRAGGARRDAVRALLRLGGRHAAVPVPARPPRRLVRQPRPVPRAARARPRRRSSGSTATGTSTATAWWSTSAARRTGS